MKTLAVIPARMGSKGIPGKNSRDFCGKALVSWAIECGIRTCNRVCVTSDDQAILDMARQYGVEAIDRPSHLAQDDTPMLPVLQHALARQTAHEVEPTDAVVLLQPTAPLRKDEQVNQALLLLVWGPAPLPDSVVSVAPIPAHYSPDYACFMDNGLLLVPKTDRRQDCRPAFYRDGTVYAIRADAIIRGDLYGRCVPLLLGIDESCNIDDEADWLRAEQMWRERGSAQVV
jgi:CMP-N,N'-diacetyllegionaminic acid synthase